MTTQWTQVDPPALTADAAGDDWQRGQLEVGFVEPRLRGVSDLFPRTLGAYGSILPLLLGLTLALMAPFDVAVGYLSQWPTDDGMKLLGSVLSLMQNVVGSLVTAATVYGVVIHRRERRVAGFGEALRWGLIHWARMFGYSLLMGLAILLGLVLLIVPGILFAVWLFLVTPVVAIEGKRHPGVFERSKKLTEGYRGVICGALLLLILVFFVLGMTCGFIDAIVGEWWVTAIASFVLSLVTPVLAVMMTITYLAIMSGGRGLCANCGYNLMGNTSGVCPECGTMIPPTVEPWQTA